MSTDLIQDLLNAQDRYLQSEQARIDRDEAIRACVASGISKVDVARLLGWMPGHADPGAITPARVGQIVSQS